MGYQPPRRTVCRLAVAVLSVGLLVTPRVALGDARDDLTNAAQAFEQAALRLQDSDDRPRGVVRWAQPIFYAATNPSASSSIERAAYAAVKRIAAIAGVAVEEVAAADPRANYRVIMTDNEAPAAPGQAGARTCYSQTAWKAFAITKVDLYINFNSIRRIDRCLIHEALHGFGFQSHPHSGDSILSYVYNRSDLTTLDRLLIETLYDRRLTLGMPRAVAAKTACRILGEKMSTPAADIEAVCSQRK